MKIFRPEPWNDEDDLYEWVDADTGLECAIIRSAQLGHLCGYVGVPRTHPLYKTSYYDTELESVPHGCMTFSNHLVLPGKTDLWWFGFDCAHYDDQVPGLDGLGGTYKTVDFVKSEVKNLAKHLSQ